MGSASDVPDINHDVEKQPAVSPRNQTHTSDQIHPMPDQKSPHGPDTELEPVSSKGRLSLTRTETEDHNKRPECFSSTFKEILFVLTTAFAVGQSSVIIGATCVISSHIARDLHMTQAEVTWITAGSS